MEKGRLPKPGEIYIHFKDRLYQIITVAIHTETGEAMVVYQALYGDFKTYVRPLDMFMGEVNREKYPAVKQKYRFELWKAQDGEPIKADVIKTAVQNDHIEDMTAQQRNEVTPENASETSPNAAKEINHVLNNNLNDKTAEASVNALLLKFLDAESYNKKLEILTSNIKHIDDRLINDMAVALDCTVEDGPLDQRIQALIYCLQAMRRFEDRRLR